MANETNAKQSKVSGGVVKRRLVHVIGASALVIGAGLLVTSFGSTNLSVAQAAKMIPDGTSAKFETVSFADVVEQVSPAVVNIQVTQKVAPELSRMSGAPNNMREFFEHNFGNRPGSGDPRGQRKAPARVGAGSGFVIDAEGHIVTNEHVIHDAERITVTFKDGTVAEAKLIGHDEKTDLALIKIDMDKPVPFVEFGDSESVRVGEWVVTVGNPFGLGHSVNVGIVSARGRTIGAGPYDDFLQIDAQINRGNSGGPAFDANGRVIGVNAAIFSPNGGNVGIGFAIPSKLAKVVIDDLKSDGVVERGWLGVNIQMLTDDIAASLGLDNTDGVLISNVRPDGPAAKAGMQIGDVILDVNGEKIETLRELPRVIAETEPGSDAEIKVWRSGKISTVDVEIGLLPEVRQVAAATKVENADEVRVGLSLKSLDPKTAKDLGLPESTSGVVIVGIEPGSPAAETGLRAGDILTTANGSVVETPSDVKVEIAKARDAGKKSFLALVKRGENQRFVVIPIGSA
ncbi:Do family serine endopeptidase [Rhodospirillales bacterium]|nr:Do family serine endopeptidase [Rhodospirillales bacterium]